MLSSGVKKGNRVIWHVFRCGRTCTFCRDIRHDFRYRMLVSISPVFDFRYWSNSVTNSSLFGYVNQCRVLSSVQNNRRNVGSTASRYAIAPLDSCKSVISSLGRVFLGPSVYWKPQVGANECEKKREVPMKRVSLGSYIYSNQLSFR